MAAVKLTGVQATTGTSVTLLFVECGVHVLDDAVHRSRVMRVAGGVVFAAIGLAALGMGVGHAVNAGLGAGLSIAALVLAMAAGLAALAALVHAARAERRLRRGDVAPTLAVESVAWAQSAQRRGRVTVTLGLADGGSCEFSAAGVTGTELAHQFGWMLGLAASPEAPAPMDLGVAHPADTTRSSGAVADEASSNRSPGRAGWASR